MRSISGYTLCSDELPSSLLLDQIIVETSNLEAVEPCSNF